MMISFLGMALALSLSVAAAAPAPAPTPEQRAVAYLSREVPRWRAENGCYSCHHNGDAVRALFVSSRSGLEVPAAAIEETIAWLVRPSDWDRNGGEGPFSDKKLSHLQFAAALTEAVVAGQVQDRSILRRAAERLVEDQDPDGSWSLEGGDVLGSPATWGRALATAEGLLTLKAADPEAFAESIGRAARWLARRDPRTVLDAGAILLGLGNDESPVSCQRAIEFLRKAISVDGGWGPYATSPPEPFDTAVAVLALSRLEATSETTALIRRGRAFLIASQLDDGSWPETTRPSGSESFAQRLSTTGWAALALLSSSRR